MASKKDYGKMCQAPACDKKSHHGDSTFCQMHQWRLKHWGALERTPIEYMKSKTFVDDNSCWVWTGGKVGQSKRRGSQPYGTIMIGLKRFRAHRVMYELIMGKIPDGLVLDHICRNTLCINPEHLEPVTNAENVKRGYESRKALWGKES